MHNKTAIPFLAACLLCLVACAPSEQGENENAAAESGPASDAVATLEDVLQGDHRSEDNRARDGARHPAETLAFFGLEPTTHVVEIWPSGGWYTEVIAPYVNAEGKYYAAHWDPNHEAEFVRKGVEGFRAKLDSRPDIYGNAEMLVLMFPDHPQFAEPGSVDMVLTFRNVHNWMGGGYAEDMMATIFEALKPGGILGVVEHRGDPAVDQDPKAASGYVNEDFTIALAESAGFVLEASSEINANPADTKDHEAGVWSLPPTLRLGDKDRDRYTAIGESDRYTLRFRKPEAG